MNRNRYRTGLLLLAALSFGGAARGEISRLDAPPPAPWELAPPDGRAALPGAFPLPGPDQAPAPPHAMQYIEYLALRFMGEPVVAADVSLSIAVTDANGTGSTDGQAGAAGPSLVSRLQDAGEAFSPPERPIIPFAVRGTWVLAPRERDEVVTSFSDISVLDAMSRASLWKEALTSLTPTQISEMALPEGIAFASLPPAARERVLRALRPPLRVETAPADGVPNIAMLPPVDPAATRLRVRLRSTAPVLMFTVGDGDSAYESPQYFSEASRPQPPRLVQDGGENQDSPPSVRRVPNTFKPSDLDGARFPAPFGARGVMTVAEALQRAKALTGLSLLASAQYRERQVFVGSEKAPVGDVLDGIRLGFTAAWRRVGDTYFLTWDRTGLGALTEQVRENGAGLMRQAGEARLATDNDTMWAEFAMRAGFAPDDPFALTNAQRAALYAPGDPKAAWTTPYLRWPQLTAGQRAAIGEALAGKEISVPTPGESQWTQRAATSADAERGALNGQVNVEFSAQLPGVGWVALPATWSRQVDPDAVHYLRRRAEQPPAPPGATPRPPAQVQRQQPTLTPARARGVVAPVLPAEQVEPLAVLMQARGFNTLFYPLLTDGRATIASKAFPPHPSVSTGAGLVAVARVMRRHGVTVIGTLDTLAWRGPGEKGHWLERYPGWLDEDVLGRPFSEAVAGLAKAANTEAPPVRGDLVRPSEPAVVAKLEALVREAAALPEVSGVFFDAWTPSNAVLQTIGFAARLDWPAATGYALPDRLAAIQRDGIDPVDRPLSGAPTLDRTDPFSAPPAAPRPQMRVENGRLVPPPPPPGPDRLLLNRLAAIAPPASHPWTTYAVKSGADAPIYGGYRPPNPTDPLPVKVSLDPPLVYRPNNLPGNALFRVPPPDDRRHSQWPMDPSTPGIVVAEGSFARYPNPARLDFAVYDFRAAPADLLDSLRRVGLPPEP